ncbi:MAG: hypothetical protein KAG66_11165 [Methylococcales bacterium]|nr:hypothetical protein [Methylococcales bacterium]
MAYQVKKLSSDDQSRRYHLINPQGKVLLVADYGSPWAGGDSNYQVRLARPDGTTVGVLDLSAATKAGENRHITYPLLFNHAVYAVFHEYRRLGMGERGKRPFYAIEVETAHWLLLEDPDQPTLCYAIYGKMPSGLGIFLDPSKTALPAPSGEIRYETEEATFSVTLPRNRLRRADLIALCTPFLIDLSYRTKQISI